MNTLQRKQALEKAMACQELGSIIQAKEICESILQEDETNSKTHNLLGLCQYQLENYEKSVKSIERAIELNPDDCTFYINLGHSYDALKYFDKAKIVYEKAIDTDKNSAIACNELALLYKDNKEYKNALIYFKKAIKLNNKSYKYHDSIAETYSNLYKYELCIFHLQKVISICPDFYDALYSMAKCYRRMKNEKKMIEYLHRTLEKIPEHPGANHLLASHNHETSSEYSSEYAEELFDRYANYFEEHLVTTLNYKVPEIIKEKLKLLNPSKDSKILDLGCGTGLLGKTIVDIFPNLIGVDISTNMIEETRKKDIYNTLYINDINDFLIEDNHTFDLIIAADVFIYIGKLKSIFAGVKEHLSKDGYFMFTIELTTEIYVEAYQLAKNGRFSHTIEYIEYLCKDSGFEVEDKEEIILREENKVGQKGVFFTLKPL